MADMNGVIETLTGDLLRAGNADFRFDGVFDSSIETFVTNVPLGSKVRGDPRNTEFSRWTGSTWILVPKGSAFQSKDLVYRVESFSGGLVDAVFFYDSFIDSPSGFSGFSGLGRKEIPKYSGDRILGFSAIYFDSMGDQTGASMFFSVLGQRFSGPSGISGFSGLSISGSSGQSGSSGFSGTSGLAGKSGFSGPMGSSGYSGASGHSGLSGATGTTGSSGFSGIPGFSGASGSSGSSGLSGTSGSGGFSGLSGMSGASGALGSGGPSGASGFSGTNGPSGYSGSSGMSGQEGISGYSGSSGISGTSGTLGIAGTSGSSGVSGFSGFSNEDDSSTLGAIFGGKLSRTAPDTITLGEPGSVSVVRDSTNSLDITWSGTVSASMASSGAGGLDASTESASTWYAVYIIFDSSGSNPTTAMFSLSQNSPFMPFGYDAFRRLGWVRNDSAGDFLKFEQTGNGSRKLYTYDEEPSALQALSAGTSTSYSVIDLSVLVPPTARMVSMNKEKTGGESKKEFFRPPGFTVTTPMLNYENGLILVGSSQTIEYKVTAPNSIDVYVLGFVDET